MKESFILCWWYEESRTLLEQTQYLMYLKYDCLNDTLAKKAFDLSK